LESVNKTFTFVKLVLGVTACQRLLTAKALVRLQVSPNWICGGEHCAGVFFKDFVFPCQSSFSVITLHYLTNQLRVSATLSSPHQFDSRNMKSKDTGIETVLFLSFYILGIGLMMATKG
jgi:hypothetical protein